MRQRSCSWRPGDAHGRAGAAGADSRRRLGARPSSWRRGSRRRTQTPSGHAAAEQLHGRRTTSSTPVATARCLRISSRPVHASSRPRPRRLPRRRPSPRPQQPMAPSRPPAPHARRRQQAASGLAPKIGRRLCSRVAQIAQTAELVARSPSAACARVSRAPRCRASACATRVDCGCEACVDWTSHDLHRHRRKRRQQQLRVCIRRREQRARTRC